MHISKELPQFENTNVLITVLSSKDAKFYLASNSTLEELESFKANKKINEYESEWPVRGGVGAGSSAYNSKKLSLLTDFINEFSKHIEDIVKKVDISKTFIFCPSYMDRRVREVLPVKIRKTLISIYRGNYMKSHPFELLEMVEIDSDIEDIMKNGEGGESGHS